MHGGDGGRWSGLGRDALTWFIGGGGDGGGRLSSRFADLLLAVVDSRGGSGRGGGGYRPEERVEDAAHDAEWEVWDRRRGKGGSNVKEGKGKYS